MSPSAGERRLGELVVKQGFASPEDVQDALLEQRVSRKRLGAILVANGAITRPDLTAALVDQLGDVTISDETGGAGLDASGAGTGDVRRRRLFRRRRDVEPDSAGVTESKTTAEHVHSLAREARALDAIHEFRTAAQTHLDSLRSDLAQASSDLEQARSELHLRDSRIAELEQRLLEAERDRSELTVGLREEIAWAEAKLVHYRRVSA